MNHRALNQQKVETNNTEPLGAEGDQRGTAVIKPTEE
jgi:hypothetical protein